MFFRYDCNLLRSHSKKGQYKNPYQRNDIHKVVKDEIKDRILSKFRDAHYKTDRGKVDLPGANDSADSNNESGTEGGQQTSLEPTLLTDDLMDLLLETHGKLEFPFGRLPSPKEDIVIKTDNPQR